MQRACPLAGSRTRPGDRLGSPTAAPTVGSGAPDQEDIITTAIKPATWAYAEGFLAEDDVLGRARTRAAEVGVTPVSPGAGAVLRLLAATAGARAVAEVGTGTGVSGVYLLRGMRPEGVLTTIDAEAEHQRLARETFADARAGHNRVRVINGPAGQMLGRLTDGAYDLVFVDTDPTEHAAHLEQALRLLRTGGLVVLGNAFASDRVADPGQRDAATAAARAVAKAVRDDERLMAALVPAGDGLLCAVKL